jgi:hypothetical protein
MSGVKVTIEQDRLSAAVQALAQRFPEAADAIVRKVAFDVIANVAERVPVDTGRYRAGWRASLDVLDGAGSSDTVEVKKGDRGLSITVTNPVEYGPFLEYGTSTRPPGNHLASAIASVRGSLPVDEARREIRAAWEDSK